MTRSGIPPISESCGKVGVAAPALGTDSSLGQGQNRAESCYRNQEMFTEAELSLQYQMTRSHRLLHGLRFLWVRHNWGYPRLLVINDSPAGPWRHCHHVLELLINSEEKKYSLISNNFLHSQCWGQSSKRAKPTTTNPKVSEALCVSAQWRGVCTTRFLSHTWAFPIQMLFLVMDRKGDGSLVTRVTAEVKGKGVRVEGFGVIFLFWHYNNLNIFSLILGRGLFISSSW